MALFVDDVKVGGIKELCEKLKIPTTDIPYLKRTKEFEMVMDRDIHGNPKRDRDGNYETKRKIAGAPHYSVFVPSLGYEVRVRLATTQRKDKDNNYNYTPTFISMDPAEDGTTSINDPIEFTFWFLHPWCRQSPFYKAGSPAFFEYKDNDAASKSDNDNEENRINALSYIVGQYAKSMKQLRAIAKGLECAGVDDMTDEVVKKTLRTIATADPIGFINKVDSRETIFAGMVQDAVDKGILKTQSLNGMIRWYLNGKEILPVTFGMDPMNTLKDELSAKWYLYSKEIQDSLNGVNVSANLQSPELDEFFAEEQSHKIEQRAEITVEQRAYLKQMEQDAAFDAKIKKLSLVDPNDASTHHAVLSSYNKHKEAVEAYKTSLVQEEIPA